MPLSGLIYRSDQDSAKRLANSLCSHLRRMPTDLEPISLTTWAEVADVETLLWMLRQCSQEDRAADVAVEVARRASSRAEADLRCDSHKMLCARDLYQNARRYWKSAPLYVPAACAHAASSFPTEEARQAERAKQLADLLELAAGDE